MSIAVIAEKPSVARDIARVLGARQTGHGYLHGDGYIVTWAIGHLVALAQPHEINPDWKSWRWDQLPMLPQDWPLVVYEKTKDQFDVVQKILTSPKVGEVICATDAGREGELIFRYIYEAAHSTKPVKRLWISSLTPDAIRQGFARIKNSSEYDPLADAAKGRSRADWLVGLNLSRAYTLACNEELSVGRVQTPTLAMLVERELAIRNFVPQDYIEVVATFSPRDGAEYKGTWFRQPPGDSLPLAMRLPPDGEEARQIVARAKSGQAAIQSVEAETQRIPPPLLYDLTELQRHANRLYGFSAQRTLELAQSLYESHKLLSYPRTDSRHLSTEVAHTLPKVTAAFAHRYEKLLAPGTGERPLNRRFVDDAKVSDHHAIIPTPTSPEKASLSPDEQKIYDMVCRRLLSAWHEDHLLNVTRVVTVIRSGATVDPYYTTGSAVERMGWKVLDLAPARRKKEEDEPLLPSGLAPNQPQRVLDCESLRKKTRPPKRFTDATLLTAMETAGETLDEKELSDAMKERGLGTPATRASIIEVLLKREYIQRQGKSLEATDKGVRLIEIVHPEVKSPAMTGQWEAKLKTIERGKTPLQPFLEGIEEYVREVIGKVRGSAPAASPSTPKTSPTLPVLDRHPVPAGTPLEEILHQRFGFSSFRPNQEAVCRALVAGEDVLLVMPTGSGKSLCYQLPGIARGGTTLVISPLIALMDDQASKLRQQGFAVGRIHSGLDRASARQTSVDYLQGKLDFLFIAPERFKVPGFPEMLAKRKPALIAVDEAHCISQWGHDFRPDYRMIGQYLPLLRPAPVIGLTATATPIVQNDIATQLGLDPKRFIHGFRRRNIAIEVVERAPDERPLLARELLDDPARRPAIVYVPTRRQAESVASYLAADFPTAPYHAGLESSHRRDVQSRFLGGDLDVIVATIAFGMGIDKPNVRTVLHTALPSSLEAYYQEIGRAGRDGHPSRAILMHSFADTHTHMYFFERDYPDVSELEKIFRLLTSNPIAKDDLARLLRGAERDALDNSLEKLWIHGGALIDFSENITRGNDSWAPSYKIQRDQKLAQLDQMLRFTETGACRMLALIRHFGDFEDREGPCGICDFCNPESAIGQDYREATETERAIIRKILTFLSSGGDGRSTGKLHTDVYPSGVIDRTRFEEILNAMARANLVTLTEAVFETDGRKIPYRKVSRTPLGRSPDADSAAVYFPVQREVAVPDRRPRRNKLAKRKRQERTPKQAPAVQAKPPKEPVKVIPSAVHENLRNWRLKEAKKKGVPAFRIMTDKVLNAIADARPASARELLSLPGIGLRFVEMYGSTIFRILGH